MENTEKLIITGGVIIIEDNKILLVKRPIETKAFPGAWSFPGGKLESGESLEECAKRECKEEAGVEARGLVSHSFWEHVGKNSRTISHLFFAKTNGKVVENENIKWFTINELLNLEIAFGYKDLIKKELSR